MSKKRKKERKKERKRKNRKKGDNRRKKGKTLNIKGKKVRMGKGQMKNNNNNKGFVGMGVIFFEAPFTRRQGSRMINKKVGKG